MHFANPVRFSAANRHDGKVHYIHRSMPPEQITDAVSNVKAIFTFQQWASIVVAFILGGSCSAIWLLRQKRWPNAREAFSTILFSAIICVAIICAFLYFGNIPMLLVIPVSILSGFGGEILGRALVNLWIEAMTRLFGPKFLAIFGLKPAPTTHKARHESNDE